MVIVALCVTGGNNQPLCLRTYNIEATQSLQWSFWAALDIIDEKIALAHSEAQTAHQANCYLGTLTNALFVPHTYQIFGYITCTETKFMLMLEETGDATVYDRRLLEETFRELHQVYSHVLCNPFVGDSLETKFFVSSVDRVVSRASEDLAKSAKKLVGIGGD
eukprot:Platyproteum_vivax@DN8778_c0_g1_i1.p1